MIKKKDLFAISLSFLGSSNFVFAQDFSYAEVNDSQILNSIHAFNSNAQYAPRNVATNNGYRKDLNAECDAKFARFKNTTFKISAAYDLSNSSNPLVGYIKVFNETISINSAVADLTFPSTAETVRNGYPATTSGAQVTIFDVPYSLRAMGVEAIKVSVTDSKESRAYNNDYLVSLVFPSSNYDVKCHLYSNRLWNSTNYSPTPTMEYQYQTPLQRSEARLLKALEERINDPAYRRKPVPPKRDDNSHSQRLIPLDYGLDRKIRRILNNPSQPSHSHFWSRHR